MLRLPSHAGTTLELPLASTTAATLGLALLEDELKHCQQHLLSASNRDPWLLLWAVLGDPSYYLAPPTGTSEIADQLAEHLPTWLATEETSYFFSSSADAEVAWDRGESFALSHLSAENRPGDERKPHAASPATILRKLVQWLQFHAPRTAEALASKAPAWLWEATPERDGEKGNLAELSDFAPTSSPAVGGSTSDASYWGKMLAAIVRVRRQSVGLQRDFETRLEAAKLAALAQLAYGASHEINNPLTNIASRAQTLLLDERDPERRRKLATISAQAFRAFEMLADMMHFAKPPPLKLEVTDLREILETVVREMTPDAEHQHTVLELEQPAETSPMAVDRDQIIVLVRALCRNSLEALGRSGRIRLAVARSVSASTGQPGKEGAEIQVWDNGPGIPAEVRPHIFDPYFSGREAGRGLGLGLSKCWRIAQAHRGSIQVENEPGGGARFRVFLPE